MIITSFAPILTRSLPTTAAILQAAHLTLHPVVARVALSGSRGLGGNPRPDSDLDLSLVIAAAALPADEPARKQLLRLVLETTLSGWQGAVACDLAAVFPVQHCDLPCFTGVLTAPPPCTDATGCRFGIFKLQKGFRGYVPWDVIELQRMYPLIEIWRRIT